MKAIIISALFAINLVVESNAQSETRVTTKPEEALVYLNGAQITSRGKATLKDGRQTIVFEMLSNYIDQNSVQVKADAAVTILAVNYSLNYLKPQDFKEFKQLEDSVKFYTDQNARLAISRKGYEEEIAMLSANRSIGGANIGVSAAELVKLTEFVRNRMQESSLKKYELEQKEKRNAERITALSQQMNEMRNNDMKPTGEITVQLDATTAGPANFELSYYVTNCGWAPSYDIRVKDVNSKAVIAAKANIVQNTGQDWKNIKLALSTGNPASGNTQPVLNPWWLSLSDPNQPQYKTRGATRKYEMMNAPSVAGAVMMDDAPQMKEAITTATFTQVVENTGTNSTFDISIPYTILSNGKENFVEIQQYAIAANYTYLSIPKVDKDAFLLARLQGWDKSELLPGEANVYFENNYVGQTYFDTRIVDDTLSVGLGRDNNIVVKRKQVNEFKEKTSITGNTKKVSRMYEIEVRNTRKSAIEIELEDQIPLTNNEQLEVEVLETGNAQYNKETGKLTWKIKLNPGESKSISFGYAVKHPKKMIVNGL
jgi:uncharacterized protein (TIGR02231 family)